MPTADGCTTDGAGYHIYVANYAQAKVVAKDGKVVSDNRNPGGGYAPMDTNGNYHGWDATSHWADTLNRQVLCGGGCYVLDSSNNRRTYTVSQTTISYNTHFGVPGVTEASGSDLLVLASITLPDATSYQFKYDCSTASGNPVCDSPPGQQYYYGEIKRVILPSGGELSFSYDVFLDACSNKNRWVTSRTVGSGIWTYTPLVVDPVNHIQQVRVTKPTGDETVYVFKAWDGDWNTETRYYRGPATGGTLLQTDRTTYDFSHYEGYVRPLNSTTSLVSAGGT